VILVVEDDEAIQGVVEEALSEGGFEVTIAASGEEAATLLSGNKGQYQALVTDIGLRRRFDGWEGRSPRQRDQPRFPRRLHERAARRRLVIQRRPQQHHADQAFCASAASHRRFPASQYRHADRLRPWPNTVFRRK
jgi:CheY-like chemotaxis protein